MKNAKHKHDDSGRDTGYRINNAILLTKVAYTILSEFTLLQS